MKVIESIYIDLSFNKLRINILVACLILLCFANVSAKEAILRLGIGSANFSMKQENAWTNPSETRNAGAGIEVGAWLSDNFSVTYSNIHFYSINDIKNFYRSNYVRLAGVNANWYTPLYGFMIRAGLNSVHNVTVISSPSHNLKDSEEGFGELVGVAYEWKTPSYIRFAINMDYTRQRFKYGAETRAVLYYASLTLGR